MQKTIVVGAAGTGKTCFLVKSVFRLLEKDGGEILILAASSRMANSIKNGLRNATNGTALPVAVHTVRSLCEAALNASDREMQILSDFRTWFTLRQCIRSESVPLRSGYARVRSKPSFTRDMLELIEAVSINFIPIDQLSAANQTDGKLEDIKSIYEHYKGFCQQRGLVPSFDVIPKALDLLNKYGERFNHVFVDQYEDLCPGEVRAVEALIGKHTSVTTFVDAVRGDPDERAEILSAQWRLPAGMAEHVNRLLGKAIYPSSESRDEILAIAVEETAIDEVEYIAKTIRRASKRAGRKYSDFAILCRDVESSGKTIRDALREYSIPCSGGVNVSYDLLVRFVILTLQVMAKPHEDDETLKWLSSPIARLNRADVHRAYAAKKQGFLNTLREEMNKKSSFLKSGDRLREILSMLDFAKAEFRNGKNVWELVKPILSVCEVVETPRAVAIFTEMIRDIETTYEKKRELYAILSDIRTGLKRISDPDRLICEDGDAVKIMSIRESRGLEFSFVFVPRMTSDSLPARHPARQLLYGEDLDSVRAVLRGIDLPGTVEPARWREQERHLLYIAMTRAKERLYLTFARQYPDRDDCEPSPFLAELLEGEELSAANCEHYGIAYHDHAAFDTFAMPSPDDIVSRADLEIAYCRYVTELGRLDHQKAAEALEFLSSTAAMGDLMPPEPAAAVAIPGLSSGKFSPSAIRNYLSCPRRYFLSYLLKVGSEDQAGARFGRLVHDVLSKFHRNYPILSDFDLEELWSQMRGILSKAWDGKVAFGFSDNKLQGQSYRRLAGEILEAYLQGEHSRWDENRSCFLTERDIDFSFFDKYNLTGRIDRIDALASGGNEIVDFKTSPYDKEAEAGIKSKFLNVNDDPDYRPQDFQLPIYYFAGLDDKNLNPQKLVVYQLRKRSRPSGMPARRELKILLDKDTKSEKKDKFLTKADLESVKEDILQTLENMVSGVYPAEPRDDNECERKCDFSFLCDREEGNS